MSKVKGGGQALIAHPDTPARAVPGIFCTSLLRGTSEWKIDFIVSAPPAALKLPAAMTPGRADGLWHHTCFELFLRDPADGRYLEFNFSPSGQWAAYQFDSYRAGMRELDVAAPRILSSDSAQAALALESRIRQLGLNEQSIGSRLPSVPDDPPMYFFSAAFEHPGLGSGTSCQAGFSAVIEEADGTKSYWALAHPPGKPDFHHPDGFALELLPP